MIYDPLASTSILSKAIGAASLRTEVIANNIANADTPGFKASTVKFEEFLSASMDADTFRARRTRAGHTEFWDENASLTPTVVQNKDTVMRLDGNNVDPEAEMVAQARNNIYYSFLIQKLNKEIGRIKYAISEGR